MSEFGIGDKIRVDYGKNNLNNKLLHVRGFVDGLLVLRQWFKHKQRWHYSVEPEYVYTEILKDHVTIVKAKKNKVEKNDN